jgi:hypothetical protein
LSALRHEPESFYVLFGRLTPDEGRLNPLQCGKDDLPCAIRSWLETVCGKSAEGSHGELSLSLSASGKDSRQIADKLRRLAVSGHRM